MLGCKSTITITLGDQAENHVGMQKIGTLSKCGFTYEDMVQVINKYDNDDYELINLSEHCEPKYKPDPAYVLILKSCVNKYCDPNDLYHEMTELPWDSKALMYGRVVNKHARHNLCFGPIAQEPNYENGKGRIISLLSTPILSSIMDVMNDLLPHKANDLVAEGNYYYDVTKCGIGYHGDTERKKVIGIRLGATMPLVFQWYSGGAKVGNPLTFTLEHGDIYFMSEKATGNDWKKRNITTLRHAAGCDKYINPQIV